MKAENFEWNLGILLEEFLKRLNPHDFTIKKEQTLAKSPNSFCGNQDYKNNANT